MINPSGFWNIADFIEDVPAPAFRIEDSVEETPIKILENEWSGNRVRLKREDLQPAGSHKIRAACFQVSRVWERGKGAVVIPSSGNAGIAVATACRSTGILPVIFISPVTHPQKISAMRVERSLVVTSPNTINHARYAARIFDIPNLRPSTDPDAVTGFMTLGFEIYRQGDGTPPDALFIFSTSGASLLGIGEAFRLLQQKGLVEFIPEIHCVQTGANAAIAGRFDHRKGIVSTHRLAGWGGAPNTYLAPKIDALIRESGGSGWIAADDEIKDEDQRLLDCGIETSFEGVAVVSAIRRYCRTVKNRKVMGILTGRRYANTDPSAVRHTCSVTTYLELKYLLQQALDNDAGC